MSWWERKGESILAAVGLVAFLAVMGLGAFLLREDLFP